MKKHFLFTAALFAALSFGFASCENPDDNEELLNHIEQLENQLKDQQSGKDDDKTDSADKDGDKDTSSDNEQNGDGTPDSGDDIVEVKLTVKTNNSDYGTVTGSGLYEVGSEATITATPNYDYIEFVQWSDGNTENPRTVTVTSDVTYIAEFAISYTSNFTPAAFSVSADKQVYFSPGNLQYHPKNDEWRFAPSQLDYIGEANENISSTYNGWLDLFGWSTSANNFGVSTSTSSSSYSGYFVDWGTNQIGDDVPNTWRTLTYYEWIYLCWERPNYDKLIGVAQVNGVNGLILLPDGWTCPDGITFKSGSHDYDGVSYYAAYQTFTAEQWSKMEQAGAVFLPAAGYRYGSGVLNVQNYGRYWSATADSSYYALCLNFDSGGTGFGDDYRDNGQSVRLVKDL